MRRLLVRVRPDVRGPDNLTWLGLHCLCLNSFLETAFGACFGARFGFIFGPRFGGPDLGLVNKKQEAGPHFGPRFGSRFGPILGPIL